MKKQYLQTSRRLYLAKKTLINVRNQVAPKLNLHGSINDLVVIEEYEPNSRNEDEGDETDDEDVEDDGADEAGDEIAEGTEEDDDFAEGGNNEDIISQDIEDVLQEIGDASLSR